MSTSDPLDDIDPLMPIGMFSRASLVSVKALRSYHEQGLLVPASVDPSTGYRSYRVSQLTDAAVVKRLRDLDVGLADVAEVVTARDPEVTRKVIAEHERRMRSRLDDVTRIVDQLQQSVDLPSLQTPVHVRREPEAHALLVAGTVTDGDFAQFLGDAFTRLFDALANSHAVVCGPTGATYPATIDTDDEPVVAFIPIAAPVALDASVLATGVTLGIVPGASCAVMTHLGGYAEIGETYRQLGAWVARHERSTGQPIREHYVVSVDQATGRLLPDEELRTEIAWPILRAPDEATDCESTAKPERATP